MVNAVAINVMAQCSETELGHYINANGITPVNHLKSAILIKNIPPSFCLP